jgi:hypothetical protein
MLETTPVIRFKILISAVWRPQSGITFQIPRSQEIRYQFPKWSWVLNHGLRCGYLMKISGKISFSSL